MSRVLARSAAAGLALALAGHAAAQRPSRGAADACRRVDAHAGDRGSVFQPALLHGAAYRCTLRRGGPVVRVILAADGDGLPSAVRVYPRRPAPGPLQVIALEANSRPMGGNVPLQGVDLNRDGWTDLQVWTDGGSAGEIFTVLTYHPRLRRFVADTAVATLANPEPVRGRPCIRWFWSGGMAGLDHTSGDTCWTGNRWVHVRLETSDELTGRSSPGVYLFERIVRLWRGGRLRVARVDTVRYSVTGGARR